MNSLNWVESMTGEPYAQAGVGVGCCDAVRVWLCGQLSCFGDLLLRLPGPVRLKSPQASLVILQDGDEAEGEPLHQVNSYTRNAPYDLNGPYTPNGPCDLSHLPYL